MLLMAFVLSEIFLFFASLILWRRDPLIYELYLDLLCWTKSKQSRRVESFASGIVSIFQRLLSTDWYIFFNFFLARFGCMDWRRSLSSTIFDFILNYSGKHVTPLLMNFFSMVYFEFATNLIGILYWPSRSSRSIYLLKFPRFFGRKVIMKSFVPFYLIISLVGVALKWAIL